MIKQTPEEYLGDLLSTYLEFGKYGIQDKGIYEVFQNPDALIIKLADRIANSCEKCVHASKPVGRHRRMQRRAMQRMCEHPVSMRRGFKNTKGHPRGPWCPMWKGSPRPKWCPLGEDNEKV